MKKGQELEGYIEKVEFPNKGILYIEGNKVIVKDALKGQKIHFMVQKARKDKYEGRLLSVIEQAPEETETPVCSYFGLCGGCAFQTLSYDEQKNRKAEQVKELLTKVCKDLPFEGIKASPLAWGYRNKMEFSFGDACKDGDLELGMHKKGSFYDIITVDGCKIADEDFSKVVCCVLEHFRALRIPYYKKMKHIGILRHLLIRKAARTQELLIALVTTSGADALHVEDSKINEQRSNLHEMLKIEDLVRNLLSMQLKGKVAGILHIINDGLADIVQSDQTIVLHGQDYFYEKILDLTFKISPFSFFQTNSLGAEVLYKTVREFVGDVKDKVIFDLYSGTGTIAQIIAPVVSKVIGVEIVEEAVAAARENAASNGLTNCEFIAGDVLRVLDEVEDKPDFIILDPPRDGCNPKALHKILAYGVEQMVYISCKPTSLSRDLVIFMGAGYEVVRVVCADLFPWTANVETVCLLSK